jgi:hypothetical protein
MIQQDAVSEQVREQAVATVQCDVPAGWSLDEWRAVRGLAREVVGERAPWWRRLSRVSRRSRSSY